MVLRFIHPPGSQAMAGPIFLMKMAVGNAKWVSGMIQLPRINVLIAMPVGMAISEASTYQLGLILHVSSRAREKAPQIWCTWSYSHVKIPDQKCDHTHKNGCGFYSQILLATPLNIIGKRVMCGG